MQPLFCLHLLVTPITLHLAAHASPCTEPSCGLGKLEITPPALPLYNIGSIRCTTQLSPANIRSIELVHLVAGQEKIRVTTKQGSIQDTSIPDGVSAGAQYINEDGATGIELLLFASDTSFEGNYTCTVMYGTYSQHQVQGLLIIYGMLWLSPLPPASPHFAL